MGRRWKALNPHRLADAAALATALSAVRLCDSFALWELIPEETEDVVSRRPKMPLEMGPAWSRTEPLVDNVGECDPLSLWLSVDDTVFRRACGVLSASFSVSVASLDELEDERLDDFEVT